LAIAALTQSAVTDLTLHTLHCELPTALQDVVDNIQEALAVCLDELDEISQPMLDTVLMGLLPVTRSENPKTYQLTQVCTILDSDTTSCTVTACDRASVHCKQQSEPSSLTLHRRCLCTASARLLTLLLQVHVKVMLDETKLLGVQVKCLFTTSVKLTLYAMNVLCRHC
jgi:hypothetical protein